MTFLLHRNAIVLALHIQVIHLSTKKYTGILAPMTAPVDTTMLTPKGNQSSIDIWICIQPMNGEKESGNGRLSSHLEDSIIDKYMLSVHK
jgi:hypothetical protein